jgi:hypothetical protein
MVHLRRRDNITTAVHMLVEALFWFHPPESSIERRLIDSGVASFALGGVANLRIATTPLTAIRMSSMTVALVTGAFRGPARGAPGQHDCQVTVLDATDKKAAFWQVPFQIAP